MLFWFRRVIPKSGGKNPWNACVICETYKTNWQTGSHRVKEDVEFHALSSGGGWMATLPSRTGTTLRTSSRAKFASSDSRTKEQLSRNCKNHLFFFALSRRQEGHAQRQTERHQRVSASTWEEYPQLWARQG